jgi:hypothetical protein
VNSKSLENLKLEDYREKYAARLTTSISFFRSRLDKFINTGTHYELKKEHRQGITGFLCECIIRPAKEILGVNKCEKSDIPYEPLFREELLILEADIAIETDVDRSEYLLKKATKELERLRTERFQHFTDDVSTKSASEIMKITSSTLTNRKKQKMALNWSDESLDIYRQHFSKINSNNLPSHSETVAPIFYQSADLPAYDLMKDFVSPSSLGSQTLNWWVRITLSYHVCKLY